MDKIIKKEITRVRRIIQNPSDWKFLFQNKKIGKSGILLVIHESQELGASILALHITKELTNLGIDVYVISKHFGKMNKRYNEIAPVQVVYSLKSYKSILGRLYKRGFRRALFITAATGDLVRIAKEYGYEIISMIHELLPVIKMLHLENATKEMLDYSDKIIFSTSIAKKQILDFYNFVNYEKIFVKPQGTYFIKPSEVEIAEQKQLLINSYPKLKNRRIILGVGNTTKRKGFDLFIQTATMMPEYEFVWAGRKERYYDEILKGYRNPENFTYLGMLNSKQLSGAYAIADIYLMCSRFDTLPSTCFEALMFHIPVVGSKTSGGIIDIINDRNGFLTEQVDCNEFKYAIVHVLNLRLKLSAYSNDFVQYVKYVLSLF